MLREIVESTFYNHLNGGGMQDYLDTIGSELQFEMPKEGELKRKFSMTKFKKDDDSIFIQTKFNGKPFNRLLVVKAKSKKKEMYDVWYAKKDRGWDAFDKDENIPKDKIGDFVRNKLSGE